MAVPSIKNPCPEKLALSGVEVWDEQTPEFQGHFCGKCSKIVIDFTKKTTQEILDFLSARKGEDICGKLPARRLQPVAIPVRPGHPGRRVSNRTRLFSAAAMIIFGSMLFTACGSEQPQEEPVGKIGIYSATQAQQQHNYDSVMRADSAKKSTTPTPTQSTNIDSAKMVEMMKLLDSVSASKKP